MLTPFGAKEQQDYARYHIVSSGTVRIHLAPKGQQSSQPGRLTWAFGADRILPWIGDSAPRYWQDSTCTLLFRR
jgi:hypothetical protein